jgi:hypothetical protein
MKEIDEFLHFLMENESDRRIKFSKKMKYGYRYYYITFNIDDEPDTNHIFKITESIDIIVDNRNKYIELVYDHHSSSIIIEDDSLVDKWSQTLEEYINKDISVKITNLIEKSLSSCYEKNLYRMKKILPEEDESL